MNDNERSAQGFRVALATFEKAAPQILEVDLLVKGKPMRSDLLNLLSLGNSYDDPNVLSMMSDKLPAMLVFYGLLQAEAEERESAIEEELELFIQEKWQAVLESLTRQIDALTELNPDGTPGKKIPSGLKSAPTRDGIRAAIILGNKPVWDDLSARKVAATRAVKVYANIYKGIEQRIKLLNNQLYIANGLINRGIQAT